MAIVEFARACGGRVILGLCKRVESNRAVIQQIYVWHAERDVALHALNPHANQSSIGNLGRPCLGRCPP